MTLRRITTTWLLLGLCWLPILAGAQTLPTLSGPVNDFAGVIDQASAEAIDARSRALLAASGDTIVVATVQTIAGAGSIEEYAVRLFEQTGIGDRARDNGLLVLLAVEERQVRIEVGYGLEEFVTDGYAGEVIRTDMLPAFRDGQYGAGLLAAVTTLSRRIAERRNVTVEGLPAAPPAQVRETGPDAVQVIAIIAFLLFIILSSRRGGGGGRGLGRYRRGPFWYGGVGGFGGGFGGFGGGFGGFGGRGGGGFGGFGGGRSGGGGATGGW